MISLANSRERHYSYYLRAVQEEKRKEEERVVAWGIVLEHCHPSHLGELPPSPKMLDHKAWLLGLQPPRRP